MSWFLMGAGMGGCSLGAGISEGWPGCRHQGLGGQQLSLVLMRSSSGVSASALVSLGVGCLLPF